MKGTEVVIALFLALSALVCIASSIGVLTMRSVYDKLHYLAPASIIGSAFIAAAIIIEEGIISQAGAKSLLIVLVLLISGPVITQAAARAERNTTDLKDDNGHQEEGKWLFST